MIKLFVIACLLERCLAEDLKDRFYYYYRCKRGKSVKEGISSRMTFNKCYTNLGATESTQVE